MAKTATPHDVLDAQIAEAWTELLAARADWAHSPNSDTVRTEQYAETRLNRLLEQRHARRTREAIKSR